MIMDSTNSSSNKTQAEQIQVDIRQLQEQGIVSAKKKLFKQTKPSLQRANSMEVEDSPNTPAALFPHAPQRSSIESPIAKQSGPDDVMSKIVQAPAFKESFKELSQELLGDNVKRPFNEIDEIFTRAQTLIASFMINTPASETSQKQDLMENEDDLLAVTAYFSAFNAQNRQLTVQQEALLRENMARVIESIPIMQDISQETKTKYREMLDKVFTALCENMDIPYPKEHQPDKNLPERESLTSEALLQHGERLGDHYPQSGIETQLWDENPLNNSFELGQLYKKKDEIFRETSEEPLKKEPVNKSFTVTPEHQEEARDPEAQSTIGILLKKRGALFLKKHTAKESQVIRSKKRFE